MCLRRTSKTSEKVGLDKERCMLNKITAKMLTSFFVYLSLWRAHNFPGCVCSACVCLRIHAALGNACRAPLCSIVVMYVFVIPSSSILSVPPQRKRKPYVKLS